MSDDFRIMPMMQTGGNTFTTEVRGTQHTYYLTGPIEAPENYVDLCNILRTAGPQDEVIIRINSRGGFVSSERMIVNAIMESQANVKGFIEYDCMSAATGVFLACSEHGWGEHIQFMAHCSWWGSVGKNPDVKSQTEFGIKQMEEEIETTYAGLMTPEEISQCNDGKEFWFGAKELEERMGNFYEYHAERGCDNPDCQECSGEAPPSIDSIITDAVAEGVEQAMGKLLKKYTLTEKPKKVAAKKKPTKVVIAKPELKSHNAQVESQWIDTRVKTVVSEQLGVSIKAVHNDYNFVDQGADSFDLIELVMAIEEEFEIDIEEDIELSRVLTVGDAVAFIQTKLK